MCLGCMYNSWHVWSGAFLTVTALLESLVFPKGHWLQMWEGYPSLQKHLRARSASQTEDRKSEEWDAWQGEQ
eukprot:97059-Pelagomonas_calceolata.AAC.2